MKPRTPLYASLLFTTISLTDHTTYPPKYLDLFLNEALSKLVRIAINSYGRDPPYPDLITAFALVDGVP